MDAEEINTSSRSNKNGNVVAVTMDIRKKRATIKRIWCGLIVVSNYLYGDTFKASFIPLSFAPIKEGSRINNNMGSIVEVYDAKVSMRTRLYILKSIACKLALKPKRYEIFRSTVFGRWLNLRTEDHDNHMIHYLLQHQRYVKDPSVHMPFIFDIGPHTIEFGRREFCLITGFVFGDCSLDHLNGGESAFRDRVFPNISNVKGDMLYKILNNQSNFDKLLDDDVVRLCLLLALDFVFMGYELRHVIANELLNLVDDLAAWNDFLWGEHMWIELHHRVYNNDKKYRVVHLNKIAIKGKTFIPTYTLHGFVFSFKIWILEMFPNSKTWWIQEKNVIPRAVAWSDGTPFLKSDYDCLFHVRNRIGTLSPSSDEMKQPWWKKSLEYFHNVSKAITSSDVPVYTKKSRVKRKLVGSDTHVSTDDDRDVDLSPDVHHDVDEGLSVQDLTKKSRVKRKLVGSDTHVRTGDDREVDLSPDVQHDVDEGLSVQDLTKKIFHMHRDFQSRITAIEQAVNQHKTSKIGSDSDGSNVFSTTMEFDPDVSCLTENSHNRIALMKKITDISNVDAECGSDVKARNKESMCVESSPNLENMSNVAAEYMFVDPNESMCVDSFVKTSCATDLNGNTFHSDSMDVDPDRKVVHQNEFEEKISDKNLMPEFEQNIEWETLINDVARAEKIAVETLLKIIDFDVPKENQSPIQPLMTENLVEGFKTSETLKSSTTHPQSHMYVEECNDDKVRRDAKMSKYPLSPFTIPPESTQKSGLRPAQADWAIERPFFNTFKLGDKLSWCYVNGVTYGVPWFADSVEKAYFPINGENNHWVLAELHIRSGVITIYDSLPPQNTLVESRKWWLDMRQCYAEKFPKLLI
ncbi:phospholipase-like protein [Tanacetum coccineum]